MRNLMTFDGNMQSGFAARRYGLVLLVIVLLGVIGLNSIASVGTGHVGVVTLFGRVTGQNDGRRHPPRESPRQSPSIERENPGSQGTSHRAVERGSDHEPRSVRALPRAAGSRAGSVPAGRTQLPGRASGPQLPLRDAEVTASNAASSLYSDARETIARQILTDLQTQVQPRGIVIENVLLRDLQLPDTLKQAIEAKQQAQQEAQRMEFVLQRERQEAERKRVEAQGIKDFQNIVTEGISEKLLEWKGIEATVELARSSHSKVIVVGNTKTGLPLVFSGDK